MFSAAATRRDSVFNFYRRVVQLHGRVVTFLKVVVCETPAELQLSRHGGLYVTGYTHDTTYLVGNLSDLMTLMAAVLIRGFLNVVVVGCVVGSLASSLSGRMADGFAAASHGFNSFWVGIGVPRYPPPRPCGGRFFSFQFADFPLV